MRTGEEIAYLRTLLETDGSYFAKTGSHVNSQHIAPRLLWLKHNEKENFSRMRHILGSYDWIGFILTGKLHVERNWALESGMYSFSGEWMPEVLSSAGISPECLPPVASYDEALGTVTEEISHLTGLPAGIPVYAGTADHVVSAYCSVAREHGDLVLKLGGAGDVLLSLDHLVTDDRLYIDYFCSKACPYVLNGCTAASGSLLKWFSHEFGGDFKTLDIEASSVPPGSDGLVMLPYVLGEKTPVFDTEARGVLYGLTLSHTKAHVYRALLESTAYAFRHHIDVIRECGVEVSDVYITNGGSTSPLWRQIMSDVTGFPVAYIKTNPGSCLGAAFIAGIAGGYLTEDVIEDFTSQRIYSYPDERTFQSYDRGYFIYRSLYPRLKPLFHS